MSTKRALLRMTALLGLVMALGLGCSSAPNKGIQAKGRVTLAGAPLSRGQVIFTAEKGDVIRQSDVEPDGTFTVRDIPPGSYKVAVRPGTFTDADYDVGPMGKRTLKPNIQIPPIPPRYQDPTNSPLTAEVRSGKEVTLALTP